MAKKPPAKKKPARKGKGQKPKAPGKPGRPSAYTKALGDKILARLAKGEPLAQICRDDGMPAVRTVSDWKEAHPEFSAGFAHAREEGFDQIAFDCLQIADNSPLVELRSKVEAILAAKGDEDGSSWKIEAIESLERQFSDLVQERKLRIDTRLKLLSKWSQRYADKVQHANDPDNPMPAGTSVAILVQPVMPKPVAE